MGIVDLDQRHLGLRVAADYLGGKLALVAQGDRDAISILHDVVVGQNITVLGNDKPGALPFLAVFLRFEFLRDGQLAAPPQGILEGLVAVAILRHLNRGLHIDEHHGRQRLLGNLRKSASRFPEHIGLCRLCSTGHQSQPKNRAHHYTIHFFHIIIPLPAGLNPAPGKMPEAVGGKAARGEWQPAWVLTYRLLP